MGYPVPRSLLNSIGVGLAACYSALETEMELNVKLNGKREKAMVSFAQPGDFGFAESWRRDLGGDQNPVRIDAVDFAHLAIKRFEATAGLGIYANSLTDLSDHIASNPLIEVGGFIVLKCDWFPGSDIIAFSHFRRTWSNKIILDYLAAHPFITRPQENPTHVVNGAGVALLYFITQVAKQENCTALWGEATASSASFYKGVFKLDRVEDLIFASQDKLLEFAEEREKKWLAWNEAATTAELPLDKLDALEIENPPFVGSKTAMFNPSKRLAYRFLKLAYHKQMEIAKTLHFVKRTASAMPRGELAEIVFKGAREKGTLSALWSLVEKEYGDGASEENPFETAQK
jgi:hypothetical protein